MGCSKANIDHSLPELIDSPARRVDNVQGTLRAERPQWDDPLVQESGLIPPGSLLGTAAYLSSTRNRSSVRAASSCQIAGFGSQELESLLVSPALSQSILLSHAAVRNRATAVDACGCSV